MNSRRFHFLLSMVAVSSVLIAMLWISWQKWGDTIIDTGRELYIPWQLSEGKVLYRDVYVNQYGPLSSYINAALFALFGVRFMTLSSFNILMTIGIAAYIYRMFFKASGIIAATVSIIVFFSLFAFSDLTSMGIFNFVSPYAYAVTYSLALGMLVHYFLVRYGRSRSIWDIVFAGFGTGLVFICKYEAFVAIAVCFVASLFIFYPPQKRLSRRMAGLLGAGFTAFVVPTLCFLFYFSFFISLKQAFHSMMLPYIQIFESQVVANNFYRLVAGTLDVKASIGQVALSVMFYLIFAGFGFLCSFMTLRLRSRWCRITVYFVIVLGGFSVITFHALTQPYWWLNISLRGLPIVLCAALATYLYQVYANADSGALEPIKPLMIFALFALGFLAKIALSIHVFHYGFVLAMPATLVGTWIIVDFLPEYIERRVPGARWIVIPTGLVLIYGLILSHFSLSLFNYDQKGLAVGGENDRLITWKAGARDGYACSFISTRERGVRFQETLERLNKILKPEDTLLVIPEGALLNYLTRRRNPTPYTSFLLGDLVMFDESQMVENMKNHPPDYVVLADRELYAYGYNSFGVDTGPQIMNWVKQNYVTIEAIGPEPFKGLGFGTRILKRSLKPSGQETRAVQISTVISPSLQ
jgi:hypothetical protein